MRGLENLLELALSLNALEEDSELTELVTLDVD
jgi:hypothetical protein